MNDKIADLAALRAKKRQAKRKCPICRKPASEVSRPFCSEQCRRIDLDRWRTEAYRIPAEENDEEDSAPTPAADTEGES
jgi:endogenous inhibitor of DNA gyrase (YacG/DUF329 family)